MNITQKNAEWVGRFGLFIVFFWFGFIKIFGLSPANGIVESLLSLTLPLIPFSVFIIFLGVWEAAIGLLFLFPRFTRLAFGLMMVQMVTTFGPLVFLPDISWQMFAIPTLEGQYIIKNVVLVALAIMVYAGYLEKK